MNAEPSRLIAMRTACQLGYFDVDKMLASADAGQLAEWGAYWELEPYGQEWLRMSQMATAIVNEIRGIAASFSSGEGANVEYMEPDDFVPGKQFKKQEKEHQAAIAAIDDLETL